MITPGQASDKAAVPALLDGLEPARDTVVDRGCDSRAILKLIADHGSCPHIATRHHKLVRNFLAAIALACIRLWIKINEYTTWLRASLSDLNS